MSNRTQMFAALKAVMPSIWNKPGTIKEMNDLLDAAGVIDPPSAPERSDTPARISPLGLALITGFEGLAKLLPDGRVQAYPDPGTGAAPWTIGWGSTTTIEGDAITPGTIWTRAQAYERKAADLRRFEKHVRDALASALPATSQPQFDALVSFTYNVGEGNLRSSTLLRKHKAGEFAGAAAEFGKWNRAAGRVMKGLTRRRAAEAALYRSGQ